MNKKEIPLIIHQELNYLRKQYSKYFKLAGTSKPLIKFEDTDENSNFYFQINSFIKNGNDFIYETSCKPISENDLAGIARTLRFQDLETKLKNWINIIDRFDETPHYSQDPVIDSYTKEYFDEYKILDEDADFEPFDIQRQLLIDKYLENSIKFLENYQEKNQNINLSEPKDFAISLRENITQLTKNEVIKRLSKFWAICRKKGLPILKEIFFELAKELINEFGKKMLGL